mmetsp:Transcript_31285/g.87738  ORF Transcript_31285/g.87738 Transcript_31285/m.87738 type:complete len:365 (+) Transcript_31285:99-1193(+)
MKGAVVVVVVALVAALVVGQESSLPRKVDVEADVLPLGEKEMLGQPGVMGVYSYCVPLERQPLSEKYEATLVLEVEDSVDAVMVDFGFDGLAPPMNFALRGGVKGGRVEIPLHTADGNNFYGWSNQAFEVPVSGRVFVTNGRVTAVTMAISAIWGSPKPELACAVGPANDDGTMEHHHGGHNDGHHGEHHGEHHEEHHQHTEGHGNHDEHAPEPMEDLQPEDPEWADDGGDPPVSVQQAVRRRGPRSRAVKVAIVGAFGLFAALAFMCCCCQMATQGQREEYDALSQMEEQLEMELDTHQDEEDVAVRMAKEESMRSFRAEQHVRAQQQFGAPAAGVASQQQQYMRVPVLSPEQYAAYLAEQSR